MSQEQLIKDVLKLMELSSMNDQEKNMWRIMVPSMNEEELTKFKAVLEKEINQMTDIYLKVIKNSKEK